jgi:hypothetical protein
MGNAGRGFLVLPGLPITQQEDEVSPIRQTLLQGLGGVLFRLPQLPIDPQQSFERRIGKGGPIRLGLVDAAVWLRYVLLLSYRYERAVLLGDGENTLRKVWDRLGLDLPLEYDRPAAPRSAGGFLRWDRPPDAGHSTAVLADLTFATLRYLQFDKDVRALESDRYRTIRDPKARRPFADKLDGLLRPLHTVYRTRLEPHLVRPPLGPGGSMFRQSATAAEQQRWRDDLDALGRQARLGVQLHGLIRDAYRSDDPALSPGRCGPWRV